MEYKIFREELIRLFNNYLKKPSKELFFKDPNKYIQENIKEADLLEKNVRDLLKKE